jgi:hypothetical protein
MGPLLLVEAIVLEMVYPCRFGGIFSKILKRLGWFVRFVVKLISSLE